MILETSFLIDLMKGRSDAIATAEELDRSGEPMYLPSPALFELWLGAGRAARRKEEVEGVETLVSSFPVMVMTDRDAREAGLLQAALTRAGRTMGTVDVMVAGMAKARNQVIVSGDRDFRTVAREVHVRSYRRR